MLDRWEVAPLHFSKAKENARSRRYYQTLLRWVPFANDHFERWDGAPNCGYFFGGAYWYGLDTARTVPIFAALSVLGEYDEGVTGLPRSLLMERAIQGIRYLLLTHDAGPEGYVRTQGTNPYCSGKKWGGHGDNFFMGTQTGYSISSIGLAAWLLWEHLDDETRGLVQTVVTWYADRWCDKDPRDGTYFDTQVEENSWVAQGIATAMDLFPNHPRHAHWAKRFRKWAYNSVSAPLDRWDPNLANMRDDDSPLPVHFMNTSTLHPDYTAENHGFVHPTYLVLGINQRAAHALFALMGERPIEAAALHNNELLYDRVIKLCCQQDGLFAPVQGQDWWYNRQHELLVTHAVLNVLHAQPDAALLEERALERMEQLQLSHTNGCYLEEDGASCVIRPGFQTARDFENWAAQDMLYGYLLHAFGGEGAVSSDPAELTSRLDGVHHFPHGGFALHRSGTTINVFSWRNNVLAATLPTQGIWLTTPTHTNYTGQLSFRPEPDSTELIHDTRIRACSESRLQELERGMGVYADLTRAEGRIRQRTGFVSLPDGRSLYMERMDALRDCELTSLATGRIGIRNESYQGLGELCPGRRTLYIHGRSDVFEGFYSQTIPDRTVEYPAADYVNLDDRLGYVLFGSRGIRYVNRHQYPKWMGVEDILILNAADHVYLQEGEVLAPWAVLTLPDVGVEGTARAAAGAFCMNTSSDESMVLQVGGYLIYTHFASQKQGIRATSHLKDEAWVDLFRGHTRLRNRTYAWSDELPGGSSGYLECQYKMRLEPDQDVSLDITIVSDRILIANTSSCDVEFVLTDCHGLVPQTIYLEPGGFHLAGDTGIH